MIAYLIIAHNQPRHLARLVRALSSPRSCTFVHLDAKSDRKAFFEAEAAGAIFISGRVRVYWGGWSQVRATLNLLECAYGTALPFTHFALLSGSDYPLASTDRLLSYLHTSTHEHIDCVPFPSVSQVKPWERLAQRHVEGGERHNGLRAKLIRGVNRLLKRLPDRDVAIKLGSIQPYTGGQWWVLSREATAYTLAFAARGGRTFELFKRAHVPDELFFQTVIMSRPGTTVGRGLTYADWSAGRDGPSIIDHRHVDLFETCAFRLDDEFGAGPCFFARKFDEDREDITARMNALRRSGEEVG